MLNLIRFCKHVETCSTQTWLNTSNLSELQTKWHTIKLFLGLLSTSEQSKKCRHVRAFSTKLLFYTIWSFKKTVVVVNIFYRNPLIRKQVKYVKFNLHVQMTEKFMTYNGSRQQIWNFPIPFIRRRVWSKKHQPRRRFMWKSSLVTKLSHFSDEIISSPKGCRSMDSRFPS